MFRAFALTAALIAVVATPALAQDTGAIANPDRLKFAVGYSDVFDDYGAPNFAFEYHSAKEWWVLHPFVGMEANTDGGIWGGFGFAADLDLTRNIVITPFTSVGLYAEGDSKDLGGPIEFKSGVELAYKFENAHRLGVEINHKSNASIYDSNPGTEVISLNYHLPLN